MQQHIRSSVDRTADALQFGSPTAIYQQVLSPSMKRSTYGLIIMYIILVMFFPSAELMGSLLSTPRQPFVILLSTVFFVPFCIFTFIFASILFRRATTPWYVLLYPEGFISAKGRKVDTARWDQVITVRQEYTRKQGFPNAIGLLQYTLHMTDRTTLTFSETFLNLEIAHLFHPRDRDLPWFKLIGRQETEVASIYERLNAAWKQMTELIHVMEREVVTRLLPGAVAMYRAGLPVTFGQLQISVEGISDAETTLPWDEFDCIIFREEGNGRLSESVPYADSSTLAERLAWWQEEIFPQDTMLIAGKKEHSASWSLAVSEVPNAFLLMELADYALHQPTHED